MGISCKVYKNDGNNTMTFNESQIILNPTISKAICTGGFSVGNVSSACLKVGAPDYGYTKDTKVQIFYNDYQIMGDFYISTVEKCGLAPLSGGFNVVPVNGKYYTQMVMLTCYDDMTKLDDYLPLDGANNPIEGDVLCGLIETMSGLAFEDGSKMGSGLAIPLEDIKSKTAKEILGIFGCYAGCNYMIHSYNLNNSYVSRITQVPLYYSSNSFTADLNSKVTVEEPIYFTRVITRGSSDAYIDGDADTGETLTISCKYAGNASNSIIRGNISDKPYQAFKCDHALTHHVSFDAGDKIALDGASNSLMMYDFTLTLSIQGLYLSCGADTQKKTLNDSVEESGSGGSGGGLPTQITNFVGSVVSGSNTVNLSWKKPGTIDGVIIKRKRGASFSNIFEGDIAYTGAGEAATDSLAIPYYDYYYRAVTYKGDIYNGAPNIIKITARTRGKYLYNAGDKCIALTGGWGGGNAYVGDNFGSGGATFETTDVLLSCYDDTATQYKIFGIKTTGKVDFTGFTKLCVEFELVNEKVYEPENDPFYQAAINRAMPIYNISDSGNTPTAYPYAYATYRNTGLGANYGYRINANSKKLCYVYANGFTALAAIGTPLALLYNGQTQAYSSYTTYNYNANFAQPSGQNLSKGDYMGGGYTNGTNYVYSVAPSSVSLPSKNRVFVGTRGENDYDYKNLVSKSDFIQKAGVGTYTLECAITDIDNNINPPKSQAYVCIAALDAKIKIKAVWLGA